MGRRKFLRRLPVTVGMVLAVARGDVGRIVEDVRHPNRSEVTISLGRPDEFWCMDWVNYVFYRAGYALPEGHGTSPSVELSFRALRKARSFLGRGAGRAGDLVAFEFDGDSWADHVGIVESRVRGGYMVLEGNTSPSGAGSQHNGDGVYRKFRPYGQVKYLWRPPYAPDRRAARAVAAAVVAGSTVLGGGSYAVLGYAGVGEPGPVVTRTVRMPGPTVTRTVGAGVPVPTVTRTVRAEEYVFRRELRRGAAGADVRALRRVLGLRAQGGFDGAVVRRVRAVQRRHGLRADGVFGRETCSVLSGVRFK